MQRKKYIISYQKTVLKNCMNVPRFLKYIEKVRKQIGTNLPSLENLFFQFKSAVRTIESLRQATSQESIATFSCPQTSSIHHQHQKASDDDDSDTSDSCHIIKNNSLMSSSILSDDNSSYSDENDE